MKNLLLAFVCTLLSAQANAAEIIFDNGAPNFSTGIIAQTSDTAFPGYSLDDFYLEEGETEVGAIRWWGYHNAGWEPTLDFTVTLYEDSGGGIPANTASYAFNLESITYAEYDDPSLPNHSNQIYQYEANVSDIALQADVSYWIAITNSSPRYFKYWVWNASGSGDAYRREYPFEDWAPSSYGNGLAFQLLGSEVPLPAAAWLFLSALGGLGIIKRKRS